MLILGISTQRVLVFSKANRNKCHHNIELDTEDENKSLKQCEFLCVVGIMVSLS